MYAVNSPRVTPSNSLTNSERPQLRVPTIAVNRRN